MVDSVLTDCEFEGAATGVYWYGQNGMLKNLVIRKCTTGLTCTSMSGVVEDVRIESCVTGYYHALATAQLTNLQVVDVPKDGVLVSYYSGPLRMLNCNITPGADHADQGGAEESEGRHADDRIPALSGRSAAGEGACRGRGSKWKRPAATPRKERRPPRAADPNVRNSPAPLRSDGLTPLPGFAGTADRPRLDVRRRRKACRTAELRRPHRAAAAGHRATAPPPLASITVTPDATWYRAEPNEPEPTVEVQLP